ncbi:MAG: hypothetical protein M3R49_03940, partial [Chloroflexota bacterium]|nr:hypothetical protein [Chloroflexota bacterium]
MSQGTLVAGFLRALERLREAGLRFVATSAQVQNATKVGQDRETGRVGRVQQCSAAAVQVHSRRDIGPLARP